MSSQNKGLRRNDTSPYKINISIDNDIRSVIKAV